MVIMDSVVVKSAIVVINRYVIQNKDVLSLNVNLKKKGGGWLLFDMNKNQQSMLNDYNTYCRQHY